MGRLVSGVAAVVLVVGAVSAVPAEPAGAAVPQVFTDVAASDPFATAVAWLAGEGITLGCNPPANSRFCPDDAVTRGEMAAFLVRAFGYTDAGGEDFVDDDGSIFEADIERLAAAGVTVGCNPPDNTMFCPERPVTRGEMAAFLVRAFGYTDAGGKDFVDDDDSIFEADIERLAAAGVTVGCNPPDNTMFCPDQVTTREQMAAFLHRAFGQPAPDVPEPTGWLRVEGNRILLPSGDPFHGRGVNIFDTRDAGACAWTEPNVDEWIRRIDVLIDDWNVTFFRLDLVSFESSHVDGYDFVQWMDVNQDPGYLADVKEIVDHIGTRPGVYVLVTVFSHPSLDDHELPTDATMAVYRTLAETFLDSPQVLYGVTNEPHDTGDAEVWNAMNAAVTTLRSVEPAAGPHHLIAVQGTQEWARRLDYYVTHPITAGGGDGIVYETHVYNPPEDWQGQFIEPAETLPVIIGEYGPDGTYMKTVAVARQLMATAEAHGIPYIGWSFSSQNGPTMLEGDDPSECRQDGWPLVPTEWGQAIIDRLGVPW